MFKFIIALMLPLVFFACSKNPVDTNQQATEKGAMNITTVWPAAKLAVATLSATATINGVAPSTYKLTFFLKDQGGGDFEAVGIGVPFGSYTVTVNGYDGLFGSGNLIHSGVSETVVIDCLSAVEVIVIMSF